MNMTISNILKQKDLEDIISSPQLVVVHFYAEWAEQCPLMNEVIEELAKQSELKTVKFAKCPAEDLPELSLKYNISAVPTFLFFRSGELVDRLEGANAAELNKKISKLANVAIPEKPKKNLDDRLKDLINAAPVMLFMKGNAQEPRCGFSKTIIGLLNSLNAEYKTFDILQDEDVRQGLKTYSDWPTYPQLYIKGELVGGLDIVKELKESGELEKMLPKKQTLEDKLKSLINQTKIMVFMKGNRETPRCGFSRQLMEILSELKVDFQTFDILTDEEVRQGLKTFSDWPTYPQLYVKGELIGGLDIIKELNSSGELVSTLNG